MIISDTFVIEKPFGKENVWLVEGGSGDLERMKRVVEMERGKVGLRMQAGNGVGGKGGKKGG